MKLKRRTPNGAVTGELEIPSGNDPAQNACLTLTLGYGLTFLDGRTITVNDPDKSVVVQGSDHKCYAIDGEGWAFPALNWGLDAIEKFHRLFRRGEYIWNQVFYLETPIHYDDLDFTSPACPGFVLRPNVLCLFRLSTDVKYTRNGCWNFNVVRLDPSVRTVTHAETGKAKKVRGPIDFRSYEKLLTDFNVYTPRLGSGLVNALGHELGHALGEEHILALKGDTQCKQNAHANDERCYGETPEERANIMGKGDQMTWLNAKPWQDHLELALGPDARSFRVGLMADPNVRPLPPRRIRVGQASKLPSGPPVVYPRFQPVGAAGR